MEILLGQFGKIPLVTDIDIGYAQIYAGGEEDGGSSALEWTGRVYH
jgi:hypothetical protein